MDTAIYATGGNCYGHERLVNKLDGGAVCPTLRLSRKRSFAENGQPTVWADTRRRLNDTESAGGPVKT